MVSFRMKELAGFSFLMKRIVLFQKIQTIVYFICKVCLLWLLSVKGMREILDKF